MTRFRRSPAGCAKAAEALRLSYKRRPAVPTTAPVVGTAGRPRGRFPRHLGRLCPPCAERAGRKRTGRKRITDRGRRTAREHEDFSVMADKPRFYITTAISYPNGVPHIGHAYE